MRFGVVIETSGRAGSIAWVDAGVVTQSIDLPGDRRTAAALAPAIDRLLLDVDSPQTGADYVAVASGPGSFTGLRIGVTTAKMLAYAWQCPIVAVDTLAAMAAAVWAARPLPPPDDVSVPDALQGTNHVWVALNAYRNQVFVADWTREQWLRDCQHGQFDGRSRVWPRARWDQCAESFGATAAIAADPALAAGQPTVQPLLPTATDVARLIGPILRSGNVSTAVSLLPRYLRDSAAEEQLR